MRRGAMLKSAVGIFREMPYWMVKQCDEGVTEGEQRVNDWLTGLAWERSGETRTQEGRWAKWAGKVHL